MLPFFNTGRYENPMAKTTVTCPRCRQPVLADVERLFDMTVNPAAKQQLLSGAVNMIQCPNCGYEGPVNQPIVYHDPEKELLLTYFPTELSLSVNDQERSIGPLITQVVNNLPMEKRKAYLFQPKMMLTMDTLIETILGADGITREMIEGQQRRLALVQRLLETDPSNLDTIIKQEEALIDETFFALFNRIFQAAASQGDKETAEALALLQNQLLDKTSAGQALKEQIQESEAAVKSLQEASQQGLTREKLLDLMVEAPTDVRLTTLVNMTRSGMDYEFFSLLSKRIEDANAEEQEKLNALRVKLLQMTKEIDEAIAEEMENAKKGLEMILNAPNVEEAILQNAESIDEFFVNVVNSELKAAREKGDLQRSAKLQNVLDVLKKLSAPPAEVELIEKLIRAESPEEQQKILDSSSALVNDQFLQILNSLIGQSQKENQPVEVQQRLQDLYRMALKTSMKAKLQA